MSCGYQIGQALNNRRAGAAAFSDEEWATVEKLGTLRVLPTANETFLAKLEQHVAASGDPNPAKSVTMSCGYQIGQALGKRRIGGAAFSDAEWATVEQLGTRRINPRAKKR